MNHVHRICFDICVAALSADLGTFLDDPANGYVKLPNGKYTEREK